jgi:hypothetical protein
MKLIDKSIFEIVAGYDDVLQAETQLRAQWRPRLLAAYAQRKEHTGQEEGTPKRKQLLFLASVLFGVLFLLVGTGLACRGILHPRENLLGYCCGGPLLALLGVLIFGAAGFSRRGTRNQSTGRVPLHPLRSGIFPDLRTSWMAGLEGELKTEVSDHPDHRNKSEKDYGAQGERAFIQRLMEVCCETDFVIARSMQRPKEDVDLILIGDKGIWVFEVKHWSGEIYWDDRGWQRKQTYYERGGVEVTKQPEVSEPPDEQWIRAAAEVSRTLQSQAAEVLELYPELEKVRGGIVFTHEDAVFKFQPGRPTFWGPLNFWIKTLQEIELKVDLDTRSRLQIVDALLDRHHEFAPAGKQRSMRTYAKGVVQETEKQLEAWVQGQ